MSNMKVTDRSRAVAYQSCPRLRFLNYEYHGHGLQPIFSSIPLVTGSACHKGIEVLLTHVMNGQCAGDCSGSIDFAVEEALKLYDDECQRRGLELDPSEDSSYVYNEQRALIESLLRGWAIHILPQLLESYEVVEVETEDLFPLNNVRCNWCHGDGIVCLLCLKDVCFNPAFHMNSKNCEACAECAGSGQIPTLLWQSRADILLRERSTGDLYIGSIKTASDLSPVIEMTNKIDMQGMSELYAVEQRLGQPVSGLQMLYLIKGSRRRGWNSDEGTSDGPKVQDSFMIRPLMKQGITSDGDEFAWTAKWTCHEPHKQGNGRLCPGNKGHRLGKEFVKTNIWEFMDIKSWVGLLASGKVQGEGNALEQVLKLPVPQLRNKSQVQSWLRQMTSQELRIAQDAEIVNGLDEGSEEWQAELDARFPQTSSNCLKYGADFRCKFFDVCWNGIDDPLGSGLYQRRVPHHQKELELFQLKGLMG